MSSSNWFPSCAPGDIVIMDNLGSHKSAALRRLILRRRRQAPDLPPYSPDLDPIERPSQDLALDARRPEAHRGDV